MIRRRLGQDTVPEIEDVAFGRPRRAGVAGHAARRAQHVEGALADERAGPEQHARIEVALQRQAGSDARDPAGSS